MRILSIQSIRKSRWGRALALYSGFSVLLQLVFPTVSMALTSGPDQPEFTSFEPVSTTDLVNDFSGDFTYNLPIVSIPGPDGGGYSLGLSYHSGVSSEQEASWVGHGWTLNPGSITRQKVGHPDDFKDVPVVQYNKTKPNWTQTATFDVTLEINSADKKPAGDEKDTDKALEKFTSFTGRSFSFGTKEKESSPYDDWAYIPSLSFSKAIRYNNYTGFSIVNGFGGGFAAGSGQKGFGNINMGISSSAGESTYSISAGISPMRFFSRKLNKKLWKYLGQAHRDYMEDRTDANRQRMKRRIKQTQGIRKAARKIRSYSLRWYNSPSVPYSVSYAVGRSVNFSGTAEVNPAGPVGGQMGIKGSFSGQIAIPEVEQHAFGYMYNPNYSQYAALEDQDHWDVEDNSSLNPISADYSLERPSTFNKHDKHINVAFSNADQFVSTGNGAIGGMRLHHEKIGHFYAPFVTNKTRIRQVGFELGIGQTIQIGFNAGIGTQKTDVSRWKRFFYQDDGNDESDFDTHFEYDAFDPANPPFLHMMNDAGGKLRYTSNENPFYAHVKNGLVKKKLDISDWQPEDALLNRDAGDHFGQSAYPEYSWYDDNGDITNQLYGAPIAQNADRAGQIAQIAVTGPDGSKMIYGQPVYVRKEKNLSIGLNTADDGTNKRTVHLDNALEYEEPLLNEIVSGTYTEREYARNYLLSASTTFDYVDADGNGEPSEADFGGWTKFGYRQATWTDGTWYRFRAPFTGMYYDRGRLHDVYDQTASMSAGEKEVYYLSNIETKSHVALFVTNKTSAQDVADILNDLPGGFAITETDVENAFNIEINPIPKRLDGVDAAEIAGDGTDPAAEDNTAHGDHDLEHLDKIILIAKAELLQPLTTTYFAYDYSICKGIPNSIGTTASEKGKLTLRKVWTEGRGVQAAKVSPYQFHYEYFRDYPDHVLAKYDAIEMPTTLIENPPYDAHALDAWGNYQDDGSPGQFLGKKRTRDMKPWISQRAPSAYFDPAAWHLKRIVMPSGGELHVQYEQGDYTHVQNQRAMSMVSLVDDPKSHNGYKSGDGETDERGNRFYINVEDLGIDPMNDADMGAYATRLTQHFITGNEKLYFRVLYGFKGGNGSLTASGAKSSSFTTGYTTVNAVVHDATEHKIYMVLGSKKSNGNSKKDKSLPRWVCYSELHKAGSQNLGTGSPTGMQDFDNDLRGIAHEEIAPGQLRVAESKSEANAVLQNMSETTVVPKTFDLFEDWLLGVVKNEPRKKSCQEFNHELSTFKLPVYHAKRGGGARVKRLLSYDPGIAGEMSDANGYNMAAMVYGREYHYVLEDGETSSGVATNEPTEYRDENPLVTVIERKKQRDIDKLLNGKDSKEYEGPLGESLLPGAAVNYSRVVVSNIHTGKSSPGYVVNEYHTVKDFPSVEVVPPTPISKDNDTYRKLNFNLPLGLINISQNRNWVTQGYTFFINDMHGKPKSTATFAGSYNPDSYLEESAVARNDYMYTQMGEDVNTIKYNTSTNEFDLEPVGLGQQEELAMYMSRVHEQVMDLAIELDLNIILAPAVSLGIGLGFTLTENEMNQHATSKVVRFKTFTTGKRSMVDGVTQTERTLAFDPNTGNPVLTRTYDGFMGELEEGTADQVEQINVGSSGTAHDGLLYALSLPASWMHPEMGPKDRFGGTSGTHQLTASAGQVVTYGNTNSWFGSLTSALPAATTGPAVFNDVISAEITTYKNNWFSAAPAYVDDAFDIAGHEAALDAHWYPEQTHAFRADVTDANNGAKIYGGGLFDGVGLDVSAAGWFSPTQIQAYSPHGYPIAEQNALNINSTAKFGYDNQLPVLVAQNSDYESVQFYDFEYPIQHVSANYLVDDAHSGTTALDMRAGPGQLLIKNATLSEQLASEGGLMNIWVKNVLTTVPSDPNFGLSNDNLDLRANVNGTTYNFKAIARTGEWTLYEAEIDFAGLTAGNTYSIGLDFNATLPTEQVLVDDVRLQPTNSAMACTVYTSDFRVAAQFDNQHFGTFYEYDQEGRLVRTSIETERGLKTLQEQVGGTPVVLRN